MKKGIKEEIIEKLLNEGYGNKSISYLEFLVLFQEYKGRILESQFENEEEKWYNIYER